VKTFVVRLHEDADSSPASADVPRLCGVLEQVATGLRATFRDERELVAALKAAMGTDPPGSPSDSGDPAPSGATTD